MNPKKGVRQCRLVKGQRERVAWIPAHFAVKDSYIRLIDEDGWKVESVGMWLPSISQHHGYFAGGIFHQ